MARILIVDDEKSIRRTLGEFLRDAGYEVAEAEDADAAMAQIRTAAFDVVVSDIILPRINGVELLEMILRAAPEAQVVMMTGEPTVETAAAAMRLGATDYLFKPVTKASVLRVVANATRIKLLEDTRRRLEEENRVHREELERLVAERTAQLRVSENRYRGLVETASDWVWEVNPQGRYTYASPRVFDLLGFQPSEVIGRTPFDLMSESEARRMKPIFEQIVAGQAPFAALETTHRHRDGHPVILETSGTPILAPTGELLGYLGMDRDITARRVAEEKLRKLALAVEQSPAAIFITDRAGAIEFINPKFARLTGYAEHEVRGLTPRVLKSGETPDEVYRKLWATISAGKEWRGEFHNKRKDGSLFWEDVSISAVKDASGKITHFVSVGEDVTEKKQLEALYLRAQRLESLGMLAAGIAHDLNNIFAPIGMVAPLLRTRASDLEDKEMLDIIEKSVERGGGLIRQILGFAQGVSGEIRLVHVKHLLRDIVVLLHETFPKSITVRDLVPNDLWPVMANPTQIHQVLLNLCINARDAMPEGGVLRLRGEKCLLDIDACRLLAANVQSVHVKAGPWLVLHVEDTGSGMPPEVLARIWEPFFTTKGVGKGTGLGLPTVRGIVESLCGFITVDTAPGRGTVFRVYLPAAETDAADDREKTAAVAVAGHGEAILLVDDESSIREAGATTLRNAGYHVVTAAEGAEGIARFTEARADFALVVTDFDMPGVDGAAFVHTLRMIRPTVRILSISGLAQEGRFESGEAAPDAFLAKPFTGEKLLRAVAQLLEKPRADPG